ncbi:putative eka-like protein [Erysiphe necator]|uniref:Putative eka-like protein n=1 Tax=Uncinula necator TaxID=52586 RepID=A0A0B1PAM8_UNCNE|nr:putative eka-like protein [Erysiphe necator]
MGYSSAKGSKKALILPDYKAESVLNTNAKQRAHQHDFQSLKSITVNPQPYRGKSSSQKHLDQRFFLRLSQEHGWRKLSPAGIRALLVQRLAISPTFIGKIKSVHSDFALSPCNKDAREALLKAEGGLFMPGAKLEPASN